MITPVRFVPTKPSATVAAQLTNGEVLTFHAPTEQEALQGMYCTLSERGSRIAYFEAWMSLRTGE